MEKLETDRVVAGDAMCGKLHVLKTEFKNVAKQCNVAVSVLNRAYARETISRREWMSIATGLGMWSQIPVELRPKG